MAKKVIRLSVLDLVPVLENKDDVYALAQAAQLARSAERWGYARYWVAEHHDMKHLACPAPDVLLSHIGARTEHIRLGSGALLLPHYSPLRVAETYRMLASLYPGRIDLGLGRAPGGHGHASMALSGNFIENVSKVPDKLRDLTALLRDEYQYEGVPVAARPNPPEQPEAWMLGTNKKSAEYAAVYGMGYVFGQFMSDADGAAILKSYRDAFIPSPIRQEARAIVTIGAICADTEEEAVKLAEDNKAFFRQGAAEGEEVGGTERNRKLLFGTPSQVMDQLEELSAVYGVDEFMIMTMVPDYSKRLRSYELLARECWGRA
ncbi:MsnO8 family LLM class oxidoreductase [Cohnella thailandensis]|uniref:MsnO8 family LLM class oxidoreductase n=1 Tax=Cohnella thailandensis TaxID=557557 RepID=A0A841T802_9BACL|nr:MsnO8 family LLM class oxidoreductase [Cohnella thailandensis]MBB6637301.1 MsnO8 family LLM class oxidoreductase [Cohnella thailandensis]MBP1976629.1 luciferase family oxidoreductase group 1 [Cohnella thailandensis]